MDAHALASAINDESARWLATANYGIQLLVEEEIHAQYNRLAGVQEVEDNEEVERDEGEGDGED
jgi:hypothetical protein